MMWGLDYLGGAKYKDLIVKEHPEGFAAGIFLQVDGFGNALSTIDALLATGRCPRIRIQLIWKDDHIFGEADINEAVKRFRTLFPLIQKYKKVEFQISPWCEHRATFQLIDRLFKALTAICPTGVELVNTPDKTGALYPSLLNEFHSHTEKPRSKNYQYSFDGRACVDADVESYKKNYSNAKTFFFWDCRFNGRWEDNDKTPRPLRKGWPDSKHIDSVIALHKPKGKTKLPQNTIYKSHSENKGTGDPRAEKPVFITPIKSKEVLLRANNGQIVETLKYYGTFEGGRHRYYSPSWGYEIANKARRIQEGDPVVDVVIDGVKVGRINPAFRDGSYR